MLNFVFVNKYKKVSGEGILRYVCTYLYKSTIAIVYAVAISMLSPFNLYKAYWAQVFLCRFPARSFMAGAETIAVLSVSLARFFFYIVWPFWGRAWSLGPSPLDLSPRGI